MLNHGEVIRQMNASLKSLDAWIDKAQAHAVARKYDPEIQLQFRLAPDMFPLARQIGSACDAVKFAAARLGNKPAPPHPDTETTWAQLRTRIRAVNEFVDAFSDADFANADGQEIKLAWAPGKKVTGRNYLMQLALPNFYFHVSMTYAILRHNGVDLGKSDYLGNLTLQDL